jgi:hypothetical protein
MIMRQGHTKRTISGSHRKGQFLYLLIEMENLLAKQLPLWTSAELKASQVHLARIVRQISLSTWGTKIDL